MEVNGLMVNGPVEVSGDASVGIRNVISGEVSGLANCRAVVAEAKIPSQDDIISSSSSLCAKSPELHKGLDLGMGKGGSKAPRISEKGKCKKRSQGERVKNHKPRAQKGATLRAAVAAYSLASASHAGPSKGQIILDEAQATIRMGKLIGIGFEGQEDEVLQRIIELEQLDAERVEQRKKSKARYAWKIWTEILSWWGIIWVVPQSVSQLLEWWDGFKFKKLEKSIWGAIPAAVIWNVWKAGNGCKFAGHGIIWEGLCESILMHIALWVKYHVKEVNYSVSDLVFRIKAIRGMSS